MSEDRCVICGTYVPEGRMICPNCEAWKKSVLEDNWKRALEYCDNDVQVMKNLSHGEMAQIAEEKEKKPMQTKYIDAEELWIQLDKAESFEQGRNHAYYKGLRKAKRILSEQLAADVVERKRGKWEVCGTFDDFLKCSCCGYKKPWNEDIFNFCPNCGAEMEKTDAEIR